jgi:glutaredoxin-like protein DUF836
LSRPVLLLLGKPGCHLCEVMRDVVSPVAAELGLGLEEKSILTDSGLEELYRYDIPVLLLDGREVARHRVTAAELRARLAQMAAS